MEEQAAERRADVAVAHVGLSFDDEVLDELDRDLKRMRKAVKRLRKAVKAVRRDMARIEDDGIPVTAEVRKG